MLGVSVCVLTRHNLDLGPAILCMRIMCCAAFHYILGFCRSYSRVRGFSQT